MGHVDKRTVGGIVVAVILACLVVLAFQWQVVARFAIAQGAGFATHTHISIGRMQLSTERATLGDVEVRSRAGEPLAEIQRIDVSYRLHELLRGGGHRFGLYAIEIVRPTITVIHHLDGTYNIPALKMAQGGGGPGAPLIFTARVRDGSLTVLDQTRLDPPARYLSFVDFNAFLDVNTQTRSHYTVGFNYLTAGAKYPLHGVGDINTNDGYMLQHWTAAKIPIALLVNYIINSPSLHLAAGEVTGVDARYYGLADAHGALRPHLAATAFMQNTRLYIGGLAKPVRDARGRIDVYDNGLVMRQIDGNIAGVPVQLTGGFYDLTHPSLRLSVGGNGNLAHLRQVFAAAAQLPMSGPLDFHLLVEGAATSPLTLIWLRSPQIVYNAIPIQQLRGIVAFDGREADVIGFGANYGNIAIHSGGRIALQREPDAVEMLVHLDAPSDRVPYIAQVVPGMMLHSTGLATGNDPKLIDMQGLLFGHTAAQQLAGTFRIDSRGVGTVGPFTIGGNNGTLYARATIDHPHAQALGLVDAQGLQLRPARPVPLAGFHLPPLPQVAGTFDGRMIGSEDGTRLGLLGRATLREARVNSVRIDVATARFGGDLGGLRVSSLHAQGPWGAVNSAATVLFERDRTIAQVRGADFTPAKGKGGIPPVHALDATVGARANAVHVYSAHAAIAGGDAAAVGSFGNGGRLDVSATGIDLTSMRAAGIPLQAGSLSAAATLSGSMNAPDVNGAVLLAGGRFHGYPIGGDAAFALTGSTLNVHDATIGLGPAFVGIDGSVFGLAAAAPLGARYDLDAKVRSADAHALATLVQPSVAQNLQGSIDADLHVGGSGAAPSVGGSVRVPSGSVHGLAFRNLDAQVSGNPSGIALNGGHVTVGSTTVGFQANLRPGAAQIGIRAPHADLADFNDFFDTADTLAGKGHINADLDLRGNRLDSTGDVAFTGTRFSRLEIGDAGARWHTVGRTIYANADFGGTSGRVRVGGIVAVPPIANVRDLTSVTTRSDVNLGATVRGMNLATWLPMLGINAPVAGRLDADVAVRGRYPDIDTTANATLVNGVAGRVPITKLQMAAAMARGRGSITSAILEIPSFTATASGSFSLHPNDPIDLAAHGTAPDIGALARTVSGKALDVGGALDTTLRLQGTRNRPHLSDAFTITSLRYQRMTIPRVHGDVAVDRKTVALRNGEIDLQRGKVTLAGNVPVLLSPPGIGPQNAPLSFELAADGADLSNLAPLFPKGTRIDGRIDGRVAVGGTIAAPRIDGGLALNNGSFSGPMEKVPITKATAQIAFAGTSMRLTNTHANVGGGAIDASGTASMANLRDPRTLAMNLNAKANHAHVDLPAYFKGQIDGSLAVARNPGKAPSMVGEVAIQNARIPMTALYNPKPSNQPAQSLPEVALNLRMNVGKDVHVQSPNVDVGGTGSVLLGGTTNAPRLDGSFTSTGGTVTFLRDFRLESGAVSFDPSSGIIPDIDAVATTRITNPTAAITLHVTGPATAMNVDFSSVPAYDREQILGLLAGAQAIGAVSGVQTASTANNFSAQATVQQMALAGVNTVFTRNLLEPLSTALGGALGFQNLQIYNDLQTGFGASAVKAFGKNVDLVASESFGIPKRNSVGVDIHPSDATAVEMMFYNQQVTSLGGVFGSQSVAGLNIMDPAALTSGQIMTGANGYILSFKRQF